MSFMWITSGKKPRRASGKDGWTLQGFLYQGAIFGI